MKVRIKDEFWDKRIEVVQKQMLPFQWRVLNDQEEGVEKSGVIHNFKIAAKEAEGTFHGMVFQDTDLYKWLEAVAYSLEIKEDKQLESWAQEAIRLIAKAQREDGYVNTYFQIFQPDLEWTDLTDNHELYTFGHLIEAGVAYHEATGDEMILTVVRKAADLLVSKFGYGKTQGLPGHPEIELALLRLYHLTEEENYLELAKYFILERGKKPNYFIEEPKKRIEKKIPSWLDVMWNEGFVRPVHEGTEDVSYYVASKQLVDQMVAEGHAVRACYLYTALADLASLRNDSELKDAAERLFDNTTTKQMYITGGIGQTWKNEGFTHDYHLPNEDNYCETCAGIALIFWAEKMLLMETNSKYTDVIERTLYNNTLGSMNLEGESFYYRNELERAGKDVKNAGRPGWFGCACCPPNLARLILSLNHYIAHYGKNGNILYLDQFIGATIQGETNEGTYQLVQEANMPWNGNIKVTLQQFPEKMRLGLRLPEWSASFQLKVNEETMIEGVDFTINRGYIIFNHSLSEGAVIDYVLDLQPRLAYANTLVKADAGKVAITRGPIVYCLEEEDNGNHLWQLAFREGTIFTEQKTSELQGIVRLNSEALRDESLTHGLYSYQAPKKKQQSISAIPFYARYNRSVGEMQVWHRVADEDGNNK